MRKIATVAAALLAAAFGVVGAGTALADPVVDIDASHAAEHALDHANVGPVDVLHEGVLNDAAVDVHVLDNVGDILSGLGGVLG